MPFYHKLGKIPPKRHIAFYQEDGKKLYREELFSTRGFSGVYSNRYRIRMPTRVKTIREISTTSAKLWMDVPLQWHLIHTDRILAKGDWIASRTPLFLNANITLSTVTPTENSNYFYKNAYAHELLFIHRGSGSLETEFGSLRFVPGDYLVIPKGVVSTIHWNETKSGGNKVFLIESSHPFDIPKHFRAEMGQILEEAPYCERDFRVPESLNTKDEKGEFAVRIKAGKRMFEQIWDHHPFDVVGWDGYEYPFALNIREYAPKVGKIHLPPPVHLVFSTPHFVVCNFVPRLFDFHPQAIPAPYFHSNVDSDEVIYYVEGEFMSRKGIEEGSMTLHPMGIPHGPQPGKTEASIGQKETAEYAVMVDTFAPLELTTNLRDHGVEAYSKSWLNEE